MSDLPGCPCSICEEDYRDRKPDETEPPRQPRTAEKLGLTGDGE
jgi:hypothetical protein